MLLPNTLKMEVEIISKEKIKPSCPTPSHLRIFKLSLLDQLIPAPYAPVILFYHPPINENDDEDDNINSRLHLLKTSLAETLTAFYPLAGEIKNDLSIDCNDQGAHYVEARVNYSSLDEFLSRPDLLLLLHRFLPCDVTNAGASVTNIQVNVFKCGGIAIGLCISHKILDGAALCTFLKAWTAIARVRSSTSSPGPGSLLRTSSSSSSSSSSDSILISSDSDSDSDDHQTEDATTYASAASSIIRGPNLFAATRLFPTNDDLWLRDSSIRMWGSLFIKDGKSSCVTKRFVFDASAIANLKDMANSSSSCGQVLKRGPTRVEVVSAFIWQCAMAASKQKYGFQRPSVLTHTVNLRSRVFLDDAYEAAAASDTAAAADLSLENSIGNLLWIAAARCPMQMLDEEEEVVVANNNSSASGSRILHGLVSELRNALSKVDGGFVKKMRSGEEGKSLMLECLKEIIKTKEEEEEEEEKDYYGFSSWCKFGLYEAGDFGWGKPIWVSSIASTGNSVFMNLIILVDTKLGDGIEAWVTLDQHHMALLQSNPLFQKFVSFDPTPLLLL